MSNCLHGFTLGFTHSLSVYSRELRGVIMGHPAYYITLHNQLLNRERCICEIINHARLPRVVMSLCGICQYVQLRKGTKSSHTHNTITTYKSFLPSLSHCSQFSHCVLSYVYEVYISYLSVLPLGMNPAYF